MPSEADANAEAAATFSSLLGKPLQEIANDARAAFLRGDKYAVSDALSALSVVAGNIIGMAALGDRRTIKSGAETARRAIEDAAFEFAAKNIKKAQHPPGNA